VLGASVTELEHVDIREQLLARPEKYRRNGEMEMVNQSSAQKLLDRGNASSNANVFSVCCGGSPLYGNMNTVGDEMERSPAHHRNGGSRVVGQHKYWNVVRRVFTPPPFPVLVRPGPSDRPKHVASDDPCSDIFEATSGKIIVNSCRSAVSSMHALKGASRKHPIVQRQAANAEWILKALTWPSTVPIDRNPKRVDSQLRHEPMPPSDAASKPPLPNGSAGLTRAGHPSGPAHYMVERAHSEST